MNFSRFASVKENDAASKAKPTSNLKDIILIPFYCYRSFGQYSFEDLTLDIYKVNLFSNYLNVQKIYKLSMSQENCNIQILCIRTVSSEPQVYAEREKIENPQNLRWLQMLSSPITDIAMRMFTRFCT